jgi:dihydroxy-acid dehydratase
LETISGKSLEELLPDDTVVDKKIIRPLGDPVTQAPTLAILTGNLAPKGALIKVSAASQHLLVHTGKAVVFSNYKDMLDRIDDLSLDVSADSVLVLKNAGPKGVPGMPEWGMIPIPKKLREAGITDMVRVSDSRMSGTSFGTVILHVTPEAAAGEVFAVVETGDLIQINIPARQISLLVDDYVLYQRIKKWSPPVTAHLRGYPLLYIREVLQADEGCDFDFLKPRTCDALKFVEPIVGRS